MKSVFKLRDLASKKISLKKAGGIGKLGKLGPDQDPDDWTPLSPYIMVSKHKSRLDFLDNFKGRVDDLRLKTVDAAAKDLGRAVVGGQIGLALCAPDMPTCAQNQRISPLASHGDLVTNVDLAVFRGELENMIEMIDRLER